MIVDRISPDIFLEIIGSAIVGLTIFVVSRITYLSLKEKYQSKKKKSD
jgi:hypothetical protein